MPDPPNHSSRAFRAFRGAHRGGRRRCPGSTNCAGSPPIACTGAIWPATLRPNCCACCAPARCRRRRRAICSRPTFSLCEKMPGATRSPICCRRCRGCGRRRCSWCSSPTAAGCRAISQMRGKPFPNDHLDLFFNAMVDAGHRARHLFARGRGGRARLLPDQRHPRSCRAWSATCSSCRRRSFRLPACASAGRRRRARITPRLSLATTLHEERFEEGDLAAQIDAYDRRRARSRPYRNQRDPARFGAAAFYGWSEDKARQYAVPLRADFGAFVRAKGFCLD